MTQPEGRLDGSRQFIDPWVGIHHSYEEFTQRPFYKEVNAKTVNLVSGKYGHILDIATGTGGIIEELIDLKKHNGSGAYILGVDIDNGALNEASMKFYLSTSALRHDPIVYFDEGTAENTGQPSDVFDLVTFCNAIHLTDVPASLKEVHRVLEPGGTFIGNTAFVDGIGYPTPEAADLWSSLGRGAIRKAMRAGRRPTESPKNLFKYTREQYEEMIKDAGFTQVETFEEQTLMNLEDVLAICHYDEFAAGALPGVPLDVAHKALADTAIEIFRRLEDTGEPGLFPRNWMLFKAVKPSSSQAA